MMGRFLGPFLLYAIPVVCVLFLAASFWFLSLRSEPAPATSPDSLQVLASENLVPLLRDIAAGFQRRTGVQVTVDSFSLPAGTEDLFAQAGFVVASAQDLPRSAVAPETAVSTPWNAWLESGRPVTFLWIAQPFSQEGPASRFSEFLEENFAREKIRAHFALP